uniref:Integrase catalytic domain-containing protein n=1 Tax=Fagus sylvatica TaxID=28930 RepID=A0A2N9IFR0_FAGSY
MVSEPSMASFASNTNTTMQAPLLLLSNMSNLMSVKLDSTNFIVWKHQLSSILKAYSMIDFVDGTIPSPNRFLTNAEGVLTTAVNPDFQLWNTRDQALLTLINSTLSPSVLSMVVGHNSAQEVWKTLEHRNEPVSFEEIMVLLQTEEQSISDVSDSGKDLHSMALFASATANNKNSNSQSSFYVNNSQSRGRGRNNNSHRGRGGGRFNHNSQHQYTQNQYQPNPFTQGSSPLQQKSDGSRPQCQICGKPGHQALDCYHRMDFAYQGRHPPAKLAAMASTSNGAQGGDTWLTDTGATDHLTANMNNLQVQTPYKGTDQVAVGNGQSIPINNIGHGQLNTSFYKFRLNNLLHSSKISSNLLSVHKLCKDNTCSCYFDSNKFLIQDLHSGKVIYKGLSSNGLYPIHTQPSPSFTTASPTVSAFLSSRNKWQLWHHRLGHPSDRVLVSTLPSLSSCISVRNKHVQHHCKHCLIASVETQLSAQIKFLRTDCGGEYTSNAFTDFCSSHGITHQFSCPHTPQQNGIVERKHRHIIECALTLLSHASLPTTHWTYAVTTAIHLINRLPSPHLSHKSPWEHLFHKAPDITHLKTFGCLCYPYLRPYNTHKLQPRSTPCIFLGYPSHTKGYICLDPTSHRIYISRHVIFNESEFLPDLFLSTVAHITPVTSRFDSTPWLLVMLHTCSPLSSALSPSASPLSSALSPSADIFPPASSPLSVPDTLPSPIFTPNESHPTLNTSSSSPSHFNSSDSAPSVSAPSVSVPSVSAPLHSSSHPSPSLNTHPMATRSKHGIFKPKVFHTSTTDFSETEPPTYKLASQYPKWCTVMDEEYSALQRQHTWSLVPPPLGKNIVGCKWVFKLKRHSDGSISRYKARLILALAVTYNWPLQQLDVRNAFLHGVLQEEAPRAWFESFTSQLLALGFHSSTADTSLFIYRDGSVIAFLLLYVDDIVLTGNTPSFLHQLIVNLSQVFELKDMGTLSYFLGLQIQRSTTGLTVTQTKYATDLLTKHNMVHCSPCKTPCVPNVRLSSTSGQPLTDIHAYRSLVGALHYLTFTRPDISFAVHQVCQFMNAPTDIHLTAAKRILRYLRGTLDHGLHYTSGPISLSAFSDADWAGDPNDRRSTSGMLVFLGSNPITWSAKKQLTVSRSSTEAEYRALASASAELCWLHTLIKDLGIFLSDPPILWCDNVSALAIASNPVFHARTKHIEVDFHFIRERVIRKDLQVKFVSTMDQLADIFTKGLSSPRFHDLQSKLLVPVDTLRLRGDVEDTLNCR